MVDVKSAIVDLMSEKFVYHPKAPRHTQASNDRVVADTLHWVNEQRLDQQLEPLDELRPGVKASSLVCPIAWSLCDEAGMVSVACWGYKRREQDDEGKPCWSDIKQVPQYVADFIRRFDTTNEFDQFAR